MFRHLRYHLDALNRAIDLAGKAPDAITFIGNNRHIPGNIPSHHIHKTGFDTGFAAGAFVSINFNIGTHVTSHPDLGITPPTVPISAKLLKSA
jgi:hypothetical protein